MQLRAACCLQQAYVGSPLPRRIHILVLHSAAAVCSELMPTSPPALHA